MGCGSSNSKREPIQNSNTPSKMLQDYNGNLNLSAPVAPPTLQPIHQKHGQMLHSQQSKQFTLFQEKVHPSAQDSHHQQQMHIPGTSTSTQSNATAPPLEQEVTLINEDFDLLSSILIFWHKLNDFHKINFILASFLIFFSFLILFRIDEFLVN